MTTTPPIIPTPRRRWLQFSLRTRSSSCHLPSAYGLFQFHLRGLRTNWMCKTVVLVSLLLGSMAEAGELLDLYRNTVKREAGLPKGRSHGQVESWDHEITEIGLERTTCHGVCPAYTIIVKSDGSFRYVGESFVKKEGKHTGRVKKGSFNELAKFIRDEGYMDLDSNYSRAVTDNPAAFTTVVMNGKRKVICNYANAGPTKLWAIEQLIDKLLLEAKWDDTAKPVTD